MTFPNNVNGMCEYSIIEIRCLPYNSETIKFQNDFVLICSTYLNKNDKAHGHTTFEIQSVKELSYNNSHVKEAKKFAFKGGTLRINDFVNIIEVKTDYDTKIIANLSYQYSKDQEMEYIQNKDLLLFSTSVGIKGSFSNVPYLYLPPEFKTYMDYYDAHQESKILHDAFYTLCRSTKEDSEFIEQFKELQDKQSILEKDLYDRYLQNTYKD
ncbi:MULTISPECIES: hypothetical protein [Bacillus]|uniref:hypothetical protein n=1 Tax=Bacillus TaxID=1386 RepID=UPI0004697928|nr:MULTISPECIES: hypothetical protein [Bacillus]KMN42514.1 hypothetical protein VK90_23950 [Bacillus sp. LK2]PFD28149.1 hypothetical protein CN285_30040 [Bacillus cereus]PGM56042.1 hypothetical protein CN947_24690 [Bacillus cereus]